MNFLIFDNELLSLNLINKFLTEFYHAKLITSNKSIIPLPSSPFLSIDQYELSHASQAIKNLFQHENDPFDAILTFNLSSSTSLSNIIEVMVRCKNQPPRLFLMFVNQQNEIDTNIIQVLKESSKFIQWTIIICNEINSLTATKYRIETKSHSTNQQPIGATDLLQFLRDELKLKKYLNKTIYLY